MKANTLKRSTELLKKTIEQFHHEMITRAIKEHDAEIAIWQEEEKSKEQAKAPTVSAEPVNAPDKEELAGLEIIRAILSENPQLGDREQIMGIKDYFGFMIRLGTNPQKQICRLRYRGRKKSIDLFDIQENSTGKGKKKERNVPIDNNHDLYKYKAELLKTLEEYLRGTPKKPSVTE